MAALIALGLIVAGFIALVASSSSLSADPRALARVNLPFGGGTIERVLVTRAPTREPLRVELRGNQIWPRGLIPTGQRLSSTSSSSAPGSSRG